MKPEDTSPLTAERTHVAASTVLLLFLSPVLMLALVYVIASIAHGALF
jgi:hypothetical protein